MGWRSPGCTTTSSTTSPRSTSCTSAAGVSPRRSRPGGDFIMSAAEVQPVLRALRTADIHIVALHNHMVGEQPAYYFTHFWGKGSATDLARGLKSAIDA